ncbi:ArsO family NAD(P)H-dependent flavin-containing monooxygenase [Roseivirga sp. BDSF3-8]|uniref:ArsO family NAD(P)H-dependent flavin-containing monooxygenase n=1 Tax=Roseivirga sp. BDSF3-8 TaxID=3241598 RepID=UPI003531FE19
MTYDVIVIGGGQSGLAVGYYLRREKLSYLILDAQEKPGGAWQHAWDSLTLFSQAQSSSLPGVMFPGGSDYPHRDEVINYLQMYESRYHLPVKRAVRVNDVRRKEEDFEITTNKGEFTAKTIINATGTWSKPNIPDIPGLESFSGISIHSSAYKNPELFTGKKVLIVGEGNSGAQIMSELSKVAEATWATTRVPVFLPDHIDGAYLFNQATFMYKAKQRGEEFKPASLGDIVVVPSVKEARDEGRLSFREGLAEVQPHAVVWKDGTRQAIDAIIWCTGFKPALGHLTGVGISVGDKPELKGNMSAKVAGMWFVGYGNWTGFASATLIGVGRSARKTVKEVVAYLSRQ